MGFSLLLFRLDLRLAQAITEESTSGAHLLCPTKVVKSFSAINFQAKTLRFMHNKSFTRCHKNHFQRYPDNSATFTSIPQFLEAHFVYSKRRWFLPDLIWFRTHSTRLLFPQLSLPNNATRTCVWVVRWGRLRQNRKIERGNCLGVESCHVDFWVLWTNFFKRFHSNFALQIFAKFLLSFQKICR